MFGFRSWYIQVTRNLRMCWLNPTPLIYHSSSVVYTCLQCQCSVCVQNVIFLIFMFVPCINSIKALFTFPQWCTQLWNHRNIKTFKIPRSIRHVSFHVGTIIREPFLCLTKTTVMVPYPRRLWHWPRHKRRGYGTITLVLAKNKNGSLKMVSAWTETCRGDRRNFKCFNIPVIL
jgi:hypothetical protein